MTQTRATAAVVLAAGKGTRMKSALPKVLHKVAHLPMLGHVINTAAAFDPQKIVVVVGHGAEAVESFARRHHPDVVLALQAQQLGTGHAVMQAREALADFAGDVYVLFGDTPLVQVETLKQMAAARADGASIVVLGFETPEPGGYGRLKLDPEGALEAIVEAKDATPEERQITLCNSGVMCIDGARLFGLLDRLTNNNANGEYYLTDIIRLARADGLRCAVVRCSGTEVLGVNSRLELAVVEAAWQERARRRFMMDGVTMLSPETVYLAYDTVLEPDVLLEPQVFFGPKVRVSSGATIRAMTALEGCSIAAGATVGPFARLRPGTQLGEGVHVGNFVEVKNTVLAAGAKANHLTYLGDAEVGAGANVGAGTITCNYDGFNKSRTVIGPGAFIGSNSALVAPVTVGAGANVAAGSVITADVPADALAIGRGQQVIKAGRAAELRARYRAKKEQK